jgi:PAS domain S-box-containing protein
MIAKGLAMNSLKIQHAAQLFEALGLYVSALDIESYRFIYHSYRDIDHDLPCHKSIYDFSAPCSWCPVEKLMHKSDPQNPEIYEAPHPLTQQALKKIAFLMHTEDDKPIKLDVGLDAASELGNDLEASPQWATFLADFLRHSLAGREGPLTPEELLLRTRYEELKASETEHRIFFEAHAAATLIHDREIVIQRANQRFEALIGLSRESVVKKQSLLEFVAPKERIKLINAHHRIFSGKEESTYVEVHLVDTTGTPRLCRAIMTRLPDDQHAMITLIDLSDRESSEQKLQAYNAHLEQWVEEEIGVRLKSQQRYQLLFHALRDAVFVYRFQEDPKARKHPLFSEVNQEACHLLNYSRDELLTKDITDILTPQTLAHLSQINQMLKESRALTTEITLSGQDGRTITVEANLSLETFDQEKTVIIIARDITQRLETQKQAAQQEQLLIQQSKMAAMGEMIGNIAHQWRQPLNILAAMLYNIKRDHTKERLTQGRLQEYYQEGRSLIDQMSRTIDDFRNFFRPDKKEVNFYLHEAIESAIALIAPALKAHHIQLDFDCKNRECRACGSQSEFAQALMNLLSNAKDALCERQVQKPRITISQATIKNHRIPLQTLCQIRVSDNAGGIPEAIKNRIFEPYFTTKAQGIGTGIGLYMSQLIIQKMGAQLWVENDRGGAVFTIELPEAVQ